MTIEVITLLRDVAKLADQFPKMYTEIHSVSERAKALLHRLEQDSNYGDGLSEDTHEY